MRVLKIKGIEGSNGNQLGLWAKKLGLQIGLNSMAGSDGCFISSTSNYVLSLEIAFWTDRDESGKDRY